ncbi:hypothetical protein GO755_08035 [Spirosoma sp. HMF4905]|uniref:Uncharacterized protein n=1 Tax=Spirosoma arboris TaxID=2682092 RepID=A0A7K1S864_9BACT|nr:hypothetical protein [Spirosoma arboris]MVM29977.1 hypothetical protein [Spirosoma arboris]
MGEFSRFKGLLGENIAENFFKSIGWQYISNTEFDCVQRKKHNCNKHGIDFFAAYLSPLEADVFDTVMISVKYVSSKTVKSDFKKYLNDLNTATSCFLLSKQYNEVLKNSAFKRGRQNLLIFWVDDKKELDYSLIKELKSISQEIHSDFELIHIVDNYRVNFIHSSMKFAKNIYSSEKVDFFYHQTGISEKITGGRQLSGALLPIDYLTSDILLFKIVSKKVLVICANERFEKDTFKRIVGLSQNLTSGWCQKIILAFPDYQFVKHKDIKQSVLLNFADNEFASMIEVKNFSENFFSLEAKELIAEIGAPTHKPLFDIETMLPFGDQIRQLLNHSYINKSDLQSLLKARGVFTRKQIAKEDITPFFAKTLLSPTEFEFLRRKQAAKEDSENFATTYLNSDITEDVSTVLTIALPVIKQEITKKFPNCELLNDLRVERKENGDLAINFEANKFDLNKDWTDVSSKQRGEVVFGRRENEESGKTQVVSAYSSNETRQMAAIIIKEVVSNLKKMDILPAEDKPVKLLSNDFSRVQRNHFLMSFLESIPSKVSLQFRQLTSVDFTLDTDAEGLPEEFISLKNRVDESIFTGRNLEEIKYLTDKQYRDALIFYAFVAEYHFKYDLDGEVVKGKTEIEFGFLDTRHQDRDALEKAEFESKIRNINPFVDRNVTQREYHTLSLLIRADFDVIKLANAEVYISKSPQLNLFPTNDPRHIVAPSN